MILHDLVISRRYDLVISCSYDLVISCRYDPSSLAVTTWLPLAVTI
jgi:hypothetical protein